MITPVRLCSSFSGRRGLVWDIEEGTRKAPKSRPIIEGFIEYFIMAHWKGRNEFIGWKNQTIILMTWIDIRSVFLAFEKLWKSVLEVSA